jgi:hypothetical protein
MTSKPLTLDRLAQRAADASICDAWLATIRQALTTAHDAQTAPPRQRRPRRAAPRE